MLSLEKGCSVTIKENYIAKMLLTFFMVGCLMSYVSGVVFSPAFEKKLNSYIENSMKCHNIPGMTLSVVKGDEVWSRGYGKENIALDVDVNPNTRFNIGSVTKSFTATLLGMLLSEKGLNWSSPVTDILGHEYGFVDVYRTQKLMIKDLLSHRTGLAALNLIMSTGIPKSVSRMEFCKSLKYLPSQKPVRDVFIYNNLMYAMLGHVAEVLGQDTWENLVTKRIFEPLEMNDTTILKSPADIFQPGVAQPYYYIDDMLQNGTHEIYDIHPLEPAGAIISTALDMAKWIKFHLKLGKTESGVQLIDKELMNDMNRLTTAITSLFGIDLLTKPTFPADDIIIGYGYGWFISEYRGFRKVWHSGHLNSYTSLLWTFPDVDIGFFASLNGAGSNFDSHLHRLVSFYHLADHLLELDPWLNQTSACTYPEPWDRLPSVNVPGLETPISVPNIAEFEGSYTNKILPDIEISSNSTDLILKTNRAHGVLHQSSEKDRFLYEALYPIEDNLSENNTKVYSNVTFHRDAVTLVVDSLTLKLSVDITYEKKRTVQIIG